jgi:sortase A
MKRAALALACLATIVGCASSRAGVAAPATTTTVAPERTDSPADDAGAGAASTSSTTTATTATPTTSTLAAPAPAPADDATEPLETIGEIAIARLGIDDTLYEGVTLGTLDHGPGHWPGTALPGQIGNAVIAGHRVSHSRPFRYLDRLREGDQVVFTVDGHRRVYIVTGHDIVTPDRVDIVDPTPAATATLFACHPPGSTRYRYVVHLALSTTA